MSYNTHEVLFTITDIGEGILTTINRKLSIKIKEKVKNISAVEMLMNSFGKRYETRTMDENRNKGLPTIYDVSQKRYIEDMTVITNNAFCKLNDETQSKCLKNNFDGTFYQWKLNKKCIETWNNRQIS